MKQKIRRLTAFLVALAVFTSFATCPNVEAATKLKVKSSKKITLNIGKTSIIKTNVVVNKLKYKSSNKKVATVTNKGKITAKKAGKATITVASKKNKKQKVTIKVTVVDKKMTQKTTTKSNVTTTTQQTPVGTTQSTSVTTTTQASEEAATTSGSATTEGTTSGDATTEERKVVGITAKYRGDKVPNDLEQIRQDGVELKLLYSDDSTEEVIQDVKTSNNIDINYINTEVIDGLKYANYKVYYLEFEAAFRVQLVETTTLYPIQIDTRYIGGTIPEGTIPDKQDIEASIVLSDGRTSMDADMSKVRLICYEDLNTSIYDKRKAYRYEVIYDCTFKDENNNDLYTCCYFFIYVPYE